MLFAFYMLLLSLLLLRAHIKQALLLS